LAVLDLLQALVDKSLVVADVEDAAEFRLLELIEEYARERLSESGETETLAARHARQYCAVAERAYAAWDLAPPADWLATLAPDIDNFRSALKWTLEGGGSAALGARLAAATMPVFLRLSLLDEGVAWCEAALGANPELDDATRARLRYVASMLYNNQVAFKNALAAASEALAAYERCGDSRGVVRSLSQLARQYARGGRRGEARAHAERAVSLARGLHDARLLASSLQRGATVFEPADVEIARAWFAESVELYRSLGRDEETARAFEWWSAAEAHAGYVDRALAIALEGLPLAGRDARVYMTNSIAAFAIVLGDTLAAEMSQEAFILAADVRHPVLLPLAFTYLAAVRAAQNPALAARFFGYAQARLATTEWKLDEIDDAVEAMVRKALRAGLDDSEIEALLAEGAAWDDARAIIRGHQG
jgi:tetratricopeptide (TPR) repeat protein